MTAKPWCKNLPEVTKSHHYHQNYETVLKAVGLLQKIILVILLRLVCLVSFFFFLQVS